MVIFSFLECTQVDPLPSTLPGALPGAGCAAPYGVRHPSRGAPPLTGCATPPGVRPLFKQIRCQMMIVAV